MTRTWIKRSTTTGLAVMFALAGAATGCDDDKDPDDTDSGIVDMDSGTPDDQDGSVEDAGVDSGTTDPTDAGTPDNDIQVARLSATGTFDTTFGGGDGIAVVDFGSRTDVVTGLDVHPDATHLDKIVVFGNRTVPGATDTARIIGRVLADGSGLDTAFAVQTGMATATSPVTGTHQFNLAGLNDSAKHGHVLADGSIIASGYTSQPTHVGAMAANRIILVRLDAAGAPINAFGSKGILNTNPFDFGATTEHGFAEAYGVAPIDLGGGNYAFATTGYGRVTASTTFQVAQISTRFTGTGALDSAAWTTVPAIGGVAGTVVVHPSRSIDHDSDPSTAAQSFEARGRNIVAIPGGGVIAVGSANTFTNVSGTTVNSDKDIMFTAIDAVGDPASISCTGSATDAAADGGRIVAVDSTDDYADEACFGANVSPDGDYVALACYRAQTGTDTDAVLVILELTKDGGGVTTDVEVTFRAPIALSSDANDRYDVVAFSPDSTRIYAGGYTTVDGTQVGVVSCFTTAGVACNDFGTNGSVVIPNSPAVTGLSVDSMGRVVVGGSTPILR